MPHKDKGKRSKGAGDDRHFRTDHLMGSIGGRTARGGLVTIVSHSCKFAVSIVGSAILARLLTPHDYGLIGMVAVVTVFVSMFKDLGLSLATVQRAEINYEQISTLFWVNVALSVLISLVLVIASPLIGWFYSEPRVSAIAAVTAVGFIFGGLSVQHEALLKRQMRFYSLSIIAFVAMTFGYAVGIAFAWYGVSYWALVFSQLALLAANTVGVWLACRWVPGLPRRVSGVRSMLSFGGDITAYAAINYFAQNADTVLIGRFKGAQELGFYTKSSQILGQPTDQINEPVSSVAIPALSRLAHDPERYRQAYRRMVEKVLMVTMPAVALMVATSDWLVRIMLGPQWVTTSKILVLMGITFLFQPIVNSGSWLLVTQGRTREMLRWSAINAPFSLLAIVIGLRWGAMGVAASYALARLLIINPLLFWFIGRRGPVRTSDFYSLLAPFFGAAVAVVLGCSLFRSVVPISNPVVGVLACAAVGGVCAAVVLLLIPSGRAAIVDLKSSVRLLRPSPTQEVS
jgi:PST family polysaccharide transporter